MKGEWSQSRWYTVEAKTTCLFNADGSPMTEEQKEKVNKCGPGTTGQVNMRCSGWETSFWCWYKDPTRSCNHSQPCRIHKNRTRLWL